MAAKGYRAVGRTWIEVTSGDDKEDYLDFLAVDRDTSQRDEVDELSQRRGRRPRRPIALPVADGEGTE